VSAHIAAPSAAGLKSYDQATTAASLLQSDRSWAGHLKLLGLAWLSILALFWRDAADMAAIWWNASTFNHCMLIAPIVLWLVLQRRDEVMKFVPQAWLPGAAFLFGASCIWMLGDAGGLAQLRHIGLILMLQASVLLLLGPSVTRALLFPLFYMSFMVPAGEELVPLLQTITAEMCMALLALFGIPAHINGIFITIPNGYFEVAEACSGVKFLIAMVAYGALVSNVCFKSWKRRMAFMAVAVTVPVLANGLRAFATIYYAHLTTVESAAGFDHVIYGWFFFAFVMMIVMAVGWRFFDRSAGDPWVSNFAPFAWVRGTRPVRGFLLGGLAIGAPMVWLGVASAAGRLPMPVAVSLPEVAGWTRTKAAEPAWDSRFAGADHKLLGHYRNAAGDQIDLSIALFAWQDEGREMIGFGQGAVVPDGQWTWTADAVPPAQGKAERIVTRGPVNREVHSYYVTSAGATGSAGAVKLNTLKARLFGGDQAAGAILVSAIESPERPARQTIDRFMRDIGAADVVVHRLIKQARGR
jgi:exosortase A